MIKRFKSTCRNFSRRIRTMTIMHEPYARWKPSTGLWQGFMVHGKEESMTQRNQEIGSHAALSEKRIVVLGGSSGIGLAVAQQVVARGARAIIASSNADRVKQAVATFDGKAEGHTPELQSRQYIVCRLLLKK